MKELIKKFIPWPILLQYHKVLSFLACLYYGFPSRKIIVIGVTGTGGKSTVVNLIAKVLEEANYRVGLTSGINFKVADKEWGNKTRMTMPGRFALQRLLKQMVKAGCRYAVIETTSEGIVQYRHLNIDYDVAVFTNLTQEHIESHRGFENYKKAKGKLFQSLAGKKRKKLFNKAVKKISVVNLDDKNTDYFLQFDADEKIGYGIEIKNTNKKLKIIEAKNIQFSKDGSNFLINGIKFNLKLLGGFNIYNSLAAVSVGLSQGVNLGIIKNALEKIENIPGRMEEIKQGQPFRIFIDYAHTLDSLEKVYKTVSADWFKPKDSKIISVFGSAGGGRDKSKRPVLGRLAAKYADYIILTNEDPYDENPEEIIRQISQGVKENPQKKERLNFWQITDRKEALKKALSLAKSNDIVLVTGKGCEQCIMGSNGKKISWNDQKVIEKLITGCG